MKVGLQKGIDKSIQQRDANRGRVLSALQAAGATGMTAMHLRNTLNLGESSVGAHLRFLQSEGLVSKHPELGHSCRWYFGQPKPQTPRKYKRKRITPDQWAQAWADAPIVRRLISAADAPPVHHVGVRSVWELG